MLCWLCPHSRREDIDFSPNCSQFCAASSERTIAKIPTFYRIMKLDYQNLRKGCEVTRSL